MAATSPVRVVDEQFSENIRDYTHQIWLAGLGAFAMAQHEGNKLFERLIKEGRMLESRSREVVESGVSAARAQTDEVFAKLEDQLSRRISEALRRFGMPTNDDIESLSRRVRALARDIAKLNPDR